MSLKQTQIQPSPNHPETNNEASAALCHDFTLTNSDCVRGEIIPTHQTLGQKFDLATGLLNLGIYEAKAVSVKFEVSGGPFVGVQNLGTITTYLDNTCGCPFIKGVFNGQSFPAAGTYHLKMTIDYDNKYAECNESNNVLEFDVVVVAVSPLPDLIMRSEFINPSILNPDEGQPVHFDISYLNQGSISSDSVNVSVKVDETPLGQKRGAGVGINKTNTVSINETWSSTIRGVHVVRAIADYDSLINESIETNNEATRAIIVGKAPNLHFTNFVVSDTTPTSGTTITVSATIKNDGFVNSLTTYQLLYRDNTGAEIVVAERSVTVDSAGTKTVTVPWSVIDASTVLIGRVINTSPTEYNLLDNDTTQQIGKLVIKTTGTNAICPEGQTGIARVSVKGGVPPYNKSWNTGQNGDSILVSPQTYTVTVTDADGNVAVDSVLIGVAGASPALTLTSTAATNGHNGTATVSANGNFGPFQVEWNTSPVKQTTQTATGLAPGSYDVVVTFNSGCIVRGTVTVAKINQKPTIRISSPANNSFYPSGSNITVAANASDVDGSIVKVEFFLQTEAFKLFETTTTPFQVTGNEVEPGIYPVFAKATDNDGAVAYSDTVNINVTGCTATGSILGEGYLDIVGSTVASLTSSSKFPDSTFAVVQLPSFEIPSNLADQFGARLRGYICAPVTGNYVFYVASDEQSELWLSTDSTVAHKSRIVSATLPVPSRSWLQYPGQHSVPIRLIRGAKYYVEALFKESTGNDNLAVGWLRPDGVGEGPIPGQYLSPANPGATTGASHSWQEMKDAELNDGKLTVTVTPNPTDRQFDLTTTSSSPEAVDMIVTDAIGRKMLQRFSLPANGRLNFGGSFRPGIYIIKVRQGKYSVTMKLIKK